MPHKPTQQAHLVSRLAALSSCRAALEMPGVNGGDRTSSLKRKNLPHKDGGCFPPENSPQMISVRYMTYAVPTGWMLEGSRTGRQRI